MRNLGRATATSARGGEGSVCRENCVWLKTSPNWWIKQKKSLIRLLWSKLATSREREINIYWNSYWVIWRVCGRGASASEERNLENLIWRDSLKTKIVSLSSVHTVFMSILIDQDLLVSHCSAHKSENLESIISDHPNRLCACVHVCQSRNSELDLFWFFFFWVTITLSHVNQATLTIHSGVSCVAGRFVKKNIFTSHALLLPITDNKN